MDLILLLAADIDIQSAFEKFYGYQEGRGEIFMHQMPVLGCCDNNRTSRRRLPGTIADC